ncbi:hypothetical protein C8F01DRAFT_1086803 [Mycena amicta]|nr:hypothetical protein C8F01DRAFT_1086803 [Mycena amicta]
MAALYPLAALTLLATASLSGPVSFLFRAVRRAVQQHHPDVSDGPANHNAPPPKPATTVWALFLHAANVVVASLRGTAQIITSPAPPSSEDVDKTRISDAESSEENDEIQVRPDTPQPHHIPIFALVPAPVPAPSRPALQPFPSHNVRTFQPYPPRVGLPHPPPYVDLSISWEDIWPPQPQNQHYAVKMGFNPYYSAFTRIFCYLPEDNDDHNSCLSDPDPDNIDIDDALEIVERADDEDLIQALQALTLSDTIARNNSKQSAVQSQAFLSSLPPAGASPFCPPPPPQPASAATATVTWRLDWY